MSVSKGRCVSRIWGRDIRDFRVGSVFGSYGVIDLPGASKARLICADSAQPAAATRVRHTRQRVRRLKAVASRLHSAPDAGEASQLELLCAELVLDDREDGFDQRPPAYICLLGFICRHPVPVTA